MIRLMVCLLKDTKPIQPHEWSYWLKCSLWVLELRAEALLTDVSAFLPGAFRLPSLTGNAGGL